MSILGLFFSSLQAQTPYLHEVFTNVNISSDITYGTNLTVLSGTPAGLDLKMDIYEPIGDTATARPVIIMVHGGSYLPDDLNGFCTGNKLDSSIVAMSMRFAKHGYVVAAIDFRTGWNPMASTMDARTGSYLNAFYRSVQDIRNAVRFLRWSADNGNPYKISKDKFSVIGEGTGALSAVAVGSLTSHEELLLVKFFNFEDNNYYIDTTLSGNLNGTNTCALNIGNYPSYSSEVHFIGNLGGVVGDSSWIEAGEPPVVSFHSATDPYHPYGFGAAFVATTGEFVINMSGPYDINHVANTLGNNDIYINAGFHDAITVIADSRNDVRKGLYPFPRPNIEFAPWQWWDPSHPNHANALLTNPDMSLAKAHAYTDTIIWYLAPRMAISNGLINPAGLHDLTVDHSFSVYPNPSNDIIEIQTTKKEYELIMVNIRGQIVLKGKNIKCIDVNNFAPGTYILRFNGASYLEHESIIVY